MRGGGRPSYMQSMQRTRNYFTCIAVDGAVLPQIPNALLTQFVCTLASPQAARNFDFKTNLPLSFPKIPSGLGNSHREVELSHDWGRMLAILQSLGMCILDLFKSRRRLAAENLFLRHQLSTRR